jgi:hypothetical protein
MEIFEARVLGENLSFWLKNHQYWDKKVWRTDGQTATITISPHCYRGGITRYDYNLTIMKSPKPANDCFRHHHVEELQTCSAGHDEIVFWNNQIIICHNTAKIQHCSISKVAFDLFTDILSAVCLLSTGNRKHIIFCCCFMLHNLLTYEMKENGGAKLVWGSQRYFLLQFLFFNIIPQNAMPQFS